MFQFDRIFDGLRCQSPFSAKRLEPLQHLADDDRPLDDTLTLPGQWYSWSYSSSTMKR